MSDLRGQRLNDRYRVVHPIARGGMGQVYEGLDEKLGRKVAIKVLLDDLAHDPTCRERFRREAHAAASISHPSLVSIFDLSLDTTPAYLVMELLEGPSLAALVTDEGRLPWDRATRLLIQVLDALQCLHDGGIVHRDLKPANVLVTGPRDRELAKVIDLGVAQLATGMAYQRLTTSGAVVGTPAFMAPEQLGGERVGPAADLWAVGTVAFTCLSGQRPFAARDLSSLLESVHGSAPPPLRTLAPDVPPALAKVIEDLLQKHPEDRPASARVVSDALRRVLTESEGSRGPSGSPLAPSRSEGGPSSLPRPSGASSARALREAPTLGDAPASPHAAVQVVPRTLPPPGERTQTLSRAHRMSTWAALFAGLGIFTTCVVGIALAAWLGPRLGEPSADPASPSVSSGPGAAPSSVPMPTPPVGPIRPRFLGITYNNSFDPGYSARAEAEAASWLDPQLRGCVDITRHTMRPVAGYLLYLDPTGAVLRLEQNLSSADASEAELACIEPLLRVARFPAPPASANGTLTIILMPTF